jgi:hypothetical protein
MQPVTITTMLDENHELFLKVKLPDMPPGPVEVVITPRAEDEPTIEHPQGSPEWTRAKLIAAGLVKPDRRYAPDDAEEMSEEEELGRKLAGDRPVEDYINEDREERF